MPRARILVVSDDESVHDEMRFGAPLDIQVLPATDARDAWAALSKRVPDAVVVDLQTGSAGGFALMKDMSSDPRLDHVPVLVLLERAQDAWLAQQGGAAAFRVKPIEADELIAGCLVLIPA